MTPTKSEIEAMVERLRKRAEVPSTYTLLADNQLEDCFDMGLRHKRGQKPYDYLKAWCSMLRPFAYATNDTSWGELEKLLCTVMRNYVQMKRQSEEAAAMLAALADEREWQPIETAPYRETVEVRVGEGMAFRAQLLPDASMSDLDTACDQWQAEIEGEHPPCWSGGACWESNEDETPSLQPNAWRPLPTPPEQEQ